MQNAPWIIAPENFDRIDEIVFAYNGSASSVFAIKQFTYLFPDLYNKTANIVRVNHEAEWENPDKLHLKEWLSDHYRGLNFVAIRDHVDNGLFSYMLEKKNTFLVMGAYSRNFISMFFRSSRADKLVRMISSVRLQYQVVSPYRCS